MFILRICLIALLISLGEIYVWHNVFAQEMVQKYKGYILLDQGDRNKAWYIYPGDGRRYFLGSAERGLKVMQNLAAMSSSDEVTKIPLGGSSDIGNINLRQSKSGYVLFEPSPKLSYWYISPKDQKRYYLNEPHDVTHLISKFGINVSPRDLMAIPLAVAGQESTPIQIQSNLGSYVRKTISTEDGEFLIDLATVDLSRGNVEMLSATAAKTNCYNNCPVGSLKDFVAVHRGFAGMNGAYFCPPDYAHCQSKINHYFYPFYETSTGFLVNANQVKWLQGAILVFNKHYDHYFFPDGRDFEDLAQFEEERHTKIQALVSNGPALIEDSNNVVGEQSMDNKQKYTKGYRTAIGVGGKTVYLVVARSATVPNIASIMKKLGVESALNLDGGGSSALYWNGEYKVGPGRRIPTAIIFREK